MAILVILTIKKCNFARFFLDFFEFGTSMGISMTNEKRKIKTRMHLADSVGS